MKILLLNLQNVGTLTNLKILLLNLQNVGTLTFDIYGKILIKRLVCF
ncbi:hypothetical protein LEP1GSC204_3006 [Leptospira interrogans serovar Copenhageni str. M20]|nr:hypothetical protein LEP1GSC204_3006 [Leptospira interrogans serovar Copenhageni str. M20]